MPTLEEIKQRQQATWSSGDYGKIAWVTVPLAEDLVEAVDLRPGSTVLDVACGTGHVALAAARRFAETTGVDYVPSLLETARRRAGAEELPVTFTEGDAENLPFPDDSFDYTLSTVGIMFAPNQEKTASELLRVTRPGGTIGVLNWIPAGFIGELFKTIGRHAPPPAELKPPSLWGTEDRVRELLGGGASSISFKQGALFQRFPSPEYWVDFFVSNYGPTLKASETLDENARVAFRKDLLELARKFNRASDGTAKLESVYLISIATKR